MWLVITFLLALASEDKKVANRTSGFLKRFHKGMTGHICAKQVKR